MKFSIYFSTFASISLLLTSCYSSKMLVDDDVYVVKNSELPVGESLTDETSYATYKYRQNNDMVSDDYYYDQRNYLYNNNCYDNFYWNNGCGCSYYAWNMYNSPYYSPFGFGQPSLYYGHGFYYAFGNMVYDPFTGMYFYNPYYNPYVYGGGMYNPYYPGGYYGYYNTYGGGYGGGYYNHQNPIVQYNHHQGPRGSLSGFSNTAGRTSPGVLKMSVQNDVPYANKPNTEYRIKKADAPIGSNENNTVRYNKPVTERPLSNSKPQYRPTTERVTPAERPVGRPVEGPQARPQREQPIKRDSFEPRGNAPKNNEGAPRQGGNRPTPSGKRN